MKKLLEEQAGKWNDNLETRLNAWKVNVSTTFTFFSHSKENVP